MARRSKVILCLLLAFLYVVVNFYPLRAEALPDVMSGSTTLADNIMTYYALSGSAVANTDWINTLYNSYGSSFGTIEDLANQGYLVLNDAGMWEPVQELGQMIEQAPAYSSLGLNEMFNVSAQEVAAGGGLAVASGGSILAGSLGGVASTGVVPLFGGVTAAYWGGIGIGTLIAHKLGLYAEPINKNLPITTLRSVLGQVPANSKCVYAYGIINNNKHQYILYGSNCVSYSYPSSNNIYYIGLNNRSDTNIKGYSIDINYNTNTYSSTNSNVKSKHNFVKGIVGHISSNSDNNFNSVSEFETALSNWNNNIDTPLNRNYSPDMIGQNGNLEGSYDPDSQKYQVPDMLPQVDPGVQSGKPLSLSDWLNFANAVNNNNSQTNPIPDNQSLFENILDLIRQNIPGTNPDPGGDPYSPPVVTPVPDPSYPDPVPDQQITEKPQESENPQQTEDPVDTGKPWRLPDLRQKFPFCIPWDIAKVFSKLNVNSRQAPYISWRFNPPNTPIDYTFNLDLEDFEEVATLLRTLELMAFIVGLAFATRYLIGAN